VNRRLDIDGLRAVAVLLVVLSHLEIGFLSGGFVGVDVFFVISGYVITLNLVTEYLRRSSDESDVGMISIRSFYARRIRRIVPISFFVLSCNLVAGFFLFNASRFQELIAEAVNNVFFVGNFYQIRIGTDYLNATMAQTPLRHYWSLSIEEQFYLFYPILFLTVLSLHGLQFRKRDITWSKRLILFVATVTIPSFVFSVYEVWAHPTAAYFSTLGRVWEIGFGCLICLIDTILTRKRSLLFDRLGPYLGLGLIFLSAIIYDNNTRFPGVAALLPVLGAGLLVRIPSNSGRLTVITRVLSTRVPVFIGKLSFSIYLWHWSLIVLLRFVFPDLLEANFGRLLVLLLTFLLSFFSYKLIEVPSARIHLNIPIIYRFKSTPNLWRFIQNRVAPDLKMATKFFVAIILIAASTQLFEKTPDSTLKFLDPKAPIAESITNLEDSVMSVETFTVNDVSSIDWIRETERGALVKSYTDAIVPTFSNLRDAPWGITLIDPSCRVFNETAKSQNSVDCIKPNPSSRVKVLVLGDSHAFMLAPSIYSHYNKGIDFQIIGRSGCPIGGVLKTNSVNVNHSKYCLELWTDYIPAKLSVGDYDAVILTDDGGTDLLQIDRAITNVKNLNFKDALVTFISASPRYPDPRDCVSASGGLEKCFGTPNTLGEKVIREMHEEITSTLTELTPMLCVGRLCPPVIANTFVTRDGSHFTGPFADLIRDSLKLPSL
jgi:peptidoglycan/LPS O-acetylase OafA/YrhL